MSARRRPPIGRYALLAIPLIGLGELAAHGVLLRRAPRVADWDAIAAPVAAMRRPGDLVIVAPPWADPLARHALGDELMPLRDAARPDETRYAAAIEIGILGQHADELQGWREVAREERGRFLIRRLDNPAPAEVVYDFVDHLDPAAVDVRGTSPEVACAWNPRARVTTGGFGGHPTFPRARFECPGGEFFHVGVTVIADDTFRPRRCIWSHPFRTGEIVTRFHGVPLGHEIRGHAGLPWFVERDRHGAPVTLTVRVDGDVVGSATHRDGDGWAAFALPLGAHAGAPAAEVEFAVASPDYRDRHYCFEADTR